jgi:hypothetical protein
MDQLVSKSGKSRWGEKTPAHVFHIDLIDEVFPEAQFIHIIRDARDVVRSLQNVEWSPRRIRWSVGRWTDSVAAGRSAGRRLGTGRYLEVRYEALTREPRKVVEDICSFLCEPFSESMLEFHRPENNSWGITSMGIQNKPLNRYRKLSLTERMVLWMEAGHLMRELGYR